MSKLDDLTGKTFGRWNVIRRIDDYITPSGNKFTQYECVCSCAEHTRRAVLANALKSGRSTSCGCSHAEVCRDTARSNFRTHGDSKTRLYRIWLYMRKRCYNSNASNYKDYGGRGIRVCPEWDKDYTAFKLWAIQNGYNDTLSIDRVDVNGDYTPANCRWVDRVTQANNRRSNNLMSYDGEVHTVAEWARILCVPYKSLHQKIKKYGEQAIGMYKS